MEVNIVRPFIVRALQAFYKHDSPEMIPQPDATGDRRPPVANRGPRVSSVTFSSCSSEYAEIKEVLVNRDEEFFCVIACVFFPYEKLGAICVCSCQTSSWSIKDGL